MRDPGRGDLGRPVIGGAAAVLATSEIEAAEIREAGVLAGKVLGRANGVRFDVHVVLAGPDERDGTLDAVRGLLRKLGLEDRVRLLTPGRHDLDARGRPAPRPR